jgi:hypothetical protein
MVSNFKPSQGATCPSSWLGVTGAKRPKADFHHSVCRLSNTIHIPCASLVPIHALQLRAQEGRELRRLGIGHAFEFKGAANALDVLGVDVPVDRTHEAAWLGALASFKYPVAATGFKLDRAGIGESAFVDQVLNGIGDVDVFCKHEASVAEVTQDVDGGALDGAGRDFEVEQVGQVGDWLVVFVIFVGVADFLASGRASGVSGVVDAVAFDERGCRR